MRYILPLLLVLLSCHAPDAEALSFRATVVRVPDGDSLVVEDSKGKRFELRLSGIDAPEKSQPLAEQSRDALRKFTGRSVAVEVDDLDRYGRLVARVHDGSRDVGLAQLESGLAWVYPRAEKLPAGVRARYEAAQSRAKRERLGLWSEREPVPPWVHRRAGGGAASAAAARGGAVVANRKSKLYHRADCPGHRSVAEQNRLQFASAAEAEKAGYRLAGNCPP